MQGRLHKGGALPPGALSVIWAPRPSPPSLFQLRSTFRAPDAPLALIWPWPRLAGQVFRALPEAGQAPGSRLLSVRGRAQPAAGGRLGVVAAAIWAMGAPSKALEEHKAPPFSPLLRTRKEGPLVRQKE